MRSPESIIKLLLETRGIDSNEDIKNFLYPKLKDLPHPDCMYGMKDAVAEVAEAIEYKKPILIWGDYDVDGTTGTSLLINFFREIGVTDIHFHIPNRITEGYGLNTEYFQDLPFTCEEEFLLITVDCGISNYKEIEFVKSMGGKVIVTDHHQLPEILPDCHIVNPSHPECGLHSSCLAGVGVAFYLAAAIRGYLKQNNLLSKDISLKSFLAFVALGTIADLVQLTTVNRILIRAGLETLADTSFLGLRKLIEACEIYSTDFYSEDIGFNIGPKINAAGRFGEAELIVRLFTNNDEKLINKTIKRLFSLNNTRKDKCKEALSEIFDNIDPVTVKKEKCLIALGDYHEGITGIIASKIVDQFHVPTFVFTATDEKILKGSARSVSGVNILELITNCNYLLNKFGGHTMAAGMSLCSFNLEAFKENIIAQLQHTELSRDNHNQCDLKISVHEIFSPQFLKIYKQLEPFGEGNRKPVFYDEQAEIVSARQVGFRNEHLQVTLRNKYYNNVKGVGFNLGNQIKLTQPGSQAKIYFSPVINRYKGSSSWQAQIFQVL